MLTPGEVTIEQLLVHSSGLIPDNSLKDYDDGWTSAVSSGFALVGFLSLVFVAFTLLAMGPFVRYDAYFNLDPPPPEWVPFLHVLDRVGQRAVALPILGVALWWIYRRTRSWRPVVVAGVSVFTLNLVVLVLKVVLGRAQPITAESPTPPSICEVTRVRTTCRWTGSRVVVEVVAGVPALRGHVDAALRHGIDVLWIGARTSVNPFSVQEVADALRGVGATSSGRE